MLEQGRVESQLGSDDVSLPKARKYMVGTDDVKAENARR